MRGSCEKFTLILFKEKIRNFVLAKTVIDVIPVSLCDLLFGYFPFGMQYGSHKLLLANAEKRKVRMCI